MTIPYFRSELNRLKELAREFALANPALAVFLDGDSTDPDVERLLDAVAFQNSLLRRKLECDFPQLIHSLTQLILPHYLRPLPATTIIGFTMNTSEERSIIIPAGTELSAAPVDGTRCPFRTTADLELHPLDLTDAAFIHQPGQAGKIQLSLTLRDIPLSSWHPGNLRLFLSGDPASATELYLLLSRHVARIFISSGAAGADSVLPSSCLTPAGFAATDAVLPYPPQAYPGYRLLQEYFSIPEKFLFFDLRGWEHWRQRGAGAHFSISFELDRCACTPQRIRRESFALHAVPAINLFSCDADPISLDHRAASYLIRPAGQPQEHCQIFSVDRVTGYARAAALERDFLPFELFSCDSSHEPSYSTMLSQSLRQGGHDVQLGVTFPGEIPAAGSETLSIALTCSNGSLPDRLHLGDISTPAPALPDFVAGHNITSIRPGQPPPLGPGLHRHLTSHLLLNYQSLENVERLRALLELYLAPKSHPSSHYSANQANQRRISGIEAVSVTAGQRMVRGIPMRGREISMKVRQDHFAGPGDLYLFGCVLDRFLGRYAAMNCYTRLEFREIVSGGSFVWPTRLGDRNLPH